MAKSKMERRNPLLVDKSEPVALATERGVSRLEPGQIRTDGGTQMRAGLNEETVVEYLELIQEPNEWPFPPVIVFHDGEVYWMGDGFHRVEAARRYVERERVVYSVVAEVRPGTRRDAVLWAAGANAAHGLRRTNADKRRAVETLLRDPEWSQWSDREIARRCHVDHKTVGAIRSELSGEIPQIEPRSLSADKPQIEGNELSGEIPQIEPGSLSADKPQIEGNELSGEIPQIERTVRRGDTVYTMNISGQREAPKKRVPVGYSAPAAGGPPGPPLTLEETLALVWGAVRDLVQSSEPGERLAWLNTLPDDYGFYQDTPAGRSLDAETLQAAKTQVVAELERQLAYRGDSRRRRSLAPDGQAPDQTNGVVEQSEAGAALGLSAGMDGRPRLPRAVRVQRLLGLYQEVLATLAEYSQLVGERSGSGQAEEALRVLTAMVAELEREVQPEAL
jgi:hypothetical protein